MKKIAVAVLMVAGLASCEKKERQWTKAEINAKVDSAVSYRTADYRRQAQEDLDSRLAIEVKAKADSIVHSHEKPLKDTTSKKK